MASLESFFEPLDDPRCASGQRHPLPAILLHMVVAMLGGARSYQAVAQFGRDRGGAFARAVGYTRRKTPCKATFSNVFRQLPADAFEHALRRWAAQRQAGRAVSMDGKTARGSADAQLPGVHLLSMFDPQAKTVIAQIPVGAKTNEHKKALALLDLIEVEGKTVTGDAAFCQRDLSRKVVKKGAITSGR